jgi:hypothetical protein
VVCVEALRREVKAIAPAEREHKARRRCTTDHCRPGATPTTALIDARRVRPITALAHCHDAQDVPGGDRRGRMLARLARTTS